MRRPLLGVVPRSRPAPDWAELGEVNQWTGW
jgi:hypothetical protein